MGLGIRKMLRTLYVRYLVGVFAARRFLLGFQNANILMYSLDKPALIPILKKYGAKIGQDVDIETRLAFHNCKDYSNLSIGDGCHVGKEAFFDLRDAVVLKDIVTVSMRVTFITHLDVGKSPLKELGYHDASGSILLEKGCYIGANAIILKGVTIGECAIVGAGAVVNRDVPAHAIVAGNPARVVKKVRSSLRRA